MGKSADRTIRRYFHFFKEICGVPSFAQKPESDFSVREPEYPVNSVEKYFSYIFRVLRPDQTENALMPSEVGRCFVQKVGHTLRHPLNRFHV